MLDNFEAEKPRILREISDLAEKMYQFHGGQVPEGHVFSQHTDELSEYSWKIAVVVY